MNATISEPRGRPSDSDSTESYKKPRVGLVGSADNISSNADATQTDPRVSIVQVAKNVAAMCITMPDTKNMTYEDLQQRLKEPNNVHVMKCFLKRVYNMTSTDVRMSPDGKKDLDMGVFLKSFMIAHCPERFFFHPHGTLEKRLQTTANDMLRVFDVVLKAILNNGGDISTATKESDSFATVLHAYFTAFTTCREADKPIVSLRVFNAMSKSWSFRHQLVNTILHLNHNHNIKSTQPCNRCTIF